MSDNGSDDHSDINEKIDILSMDDDKIKQVGELLSSDASRSILKLLFKNTMTANEIAKNTGISLPLVMYHLKKMQSANMVRITNVGKTIKSKDMNFYTTTKFAIIIVSDSVSKKVKESKSVKRTFGGFYRFASIAVVAGGAWFVSQFAQNAEKGTYIDTSTESTDIPQESAEFRIESPQAEMAAEFSDEMMAGVEGDMDVVEVSPEGVPAMKSEEIVPAEPVLETVPQISAQTPEGIPLDILWSALITLGVIVVGLIIERAIRSRRK